MKQYLVFVILGGHRTERLKGHIIPKRITANDANEAVEKAVEGKIFEEEGFEIVAIENVGIKNWPKNKLPHARKMMGKRFIQTNC